MEVELRLRAKAKNKLKLNKNIEKIKFEVVFQNNVGMFEVSNREKDISTLK